MESRPSGGERHANTMAPKHFNTLDLTDAPSAEAKALVVKATGAGKTRTFIAL